jgi:hypothetical protein
MKRVLQVFFLFSVFGLHNSKAQSLQRETISSTGTSVTSEGSVIRQTIGQPYNTGTNYNNSISFRPGFQQPVFKMELISSDLDLLVFPNPAVYFVTIKSPVPLVNVLLTVTDASGKLLLSEKIPELLSHQVNCEAWSNGVYFFNITDDKARSYSAKLIISH